MDGVSTGGGGAKLSLLSSPFTCQMLEWESKFAPPAQRMLLYDSFSDFEYSPPRQEMLSDNFQYIFFVIGKDHLSCPPFSRHEKWALLYEHPNSHYLSLAGVITTIIREL